MNHKISNAIEKAFSAIQNNKNPEKIFIQLRKEIEKDNPDEFIITWCSNDVIDRAKEHKIKVSKKQARERNSNILGNP